MAGQYQTITVEKRGATDWLTLDRPDALNAITTEMARELNDYFAALYHDRTTRIVVMRGAGRAFCAGLDIKDHAMRDPAAIPFGGGFGFQGFLADVYIKMRRSRSRSYRWCTARPAAGALPSRLPPTSVSRAKAQE